MKIFKVFSVDSDISLPLHDKIKNGETNFIELSHTSAYLVYDGEHCYATNDAIDKCEYQRVYISIEFVEINLENGIFSKI